MKKLPIEIRPGMDRRQAVELCRHLGLTVKEFRDRIQLSDPENPTDRINIRSFNSAGTDKVGSRVSGFIKRMLAKYGDQPLMKTKATNRNRRQERQDDQTPVASVPPTSNGNRTADDYLEILRAIKAEQLDFDRIYAQAEQDVKDAQSMLEEAMTKLKELDKRKRNYDDRIERARTGLNEAVARELAEA